MYGSPSKLDVLAPRKLKALTDNFKLSKGRLHVSSSDQALDGASLRVSHRRIGIA